MDGSIDEVLATQVLHWFGAATNMPVEIPSILSREGERIHVRAQPRRTSVERRP